nr:CoA transferase [Frankia sp. QA3]
MRGRAGPFGVELPLAGVRVLDLADGRCESTGHYLADLGAEVLRIEPPGGAASRRVGPFTDDGTSLSFAVHSINKRGAVVDLTTAAGRKRLRTLAATADILLHTARPDQQVALDLDPEGLLAAHPGLVVVSITDFGLTGPYRDWTGSSDVHVAIGGLLSRSGLPGLPPLLPPAFLADECAAAQAAWAALVAYANRLDTGRGDVVDFSVLSAVAQVLDPGYGISGSARAGATVRDLPRGRRCATSRGGGRTPATCTRSSARPTAGCGSASSRRGSGRGCSAGSASRPSSPSRSTTTSAPASPPPTSSTR